MLCHGCMRKISKSQHMLSACIASRYTADSRGCYNICVKLNCDTMYEQHWDVFIVLLKYSQHRIFLRFMCNDIPCKVNTIQTQQHLNGHGHAVRERLSWVWSVQGCCILNEITTIFPIHLFICGRSPQINHHQLQLVFSIFGAACSMCPELSTPWPSAPRIFYTA